MPAVVSTGAAIESFCYLTLREAVEVVAFFRSLGWVVSEPIQTSSRELGWQPDCYVYVLHAVHHSRID